jgi:hypothetical protein
MKHLPFKKARICRAEVTIQITGIIPVPKDFKKPRLVTAFPQVELFGRKVF